jgi:Dynamin central region
VRNRSENEIRDRESFEERDQKEDAFFASGKWKEATMNYPAMGSLDPKVLGIQHLKLTLQGHLYKRVKENLPKLRDKMRSLEATYKTKLTNMGLPRDKPRDQRVYLSEIQMLYESEVRRSLDGDYRFVDDPKHPSRLRYHVKTFNNEFEFVIQHQAIKYYWQMNDDDEEADGGGILQWISNTWAAHQGSEPRHDAPRSLKKELVKQQTESWEEKARAYIKKVENAITACNNDLFTFSCKDGDLRLKIREKLLRLPKRSFRISSRTASTLIAGIPNSNISLTNASYLA